MRYELYEGPVSEFEDLYIDVIYYRTDDKNDMVDAIFNYMSVYYDNDGTSADQVLTVYDRNADKYMKPSEFMNMLLQDASKN